MELSNTVVRRWWLIAVVAIALSLSVPTVPGQTRGQHTAKDRILAAAIKGLSSRDELERSDAIVTLFNLGKTAIPPLIDLVRDWANKYPPNRIHAPCPEGDYSECEEFYRIVERRRTDAIKLLGQLHAVEAVPLLIAIMGLEGSRPFGWYYGPEQDALVEIGKEAVPQLLDEMRRAEESRQTSVDSLQANAVADKIEERIAMVLGNIGDPGALPLLEELSGKLTSLAPRSFVETAIREIKERQTLRQSAVPKTIRKPKQ